MEYNLSEEYASDFRETKKEIGELESSISLKESYNKLLVNKDFKKVFNFLLKDRLESLMLQLAVTTEPNLKNKFLEDIQSIAFIKRAFKELDVESLQDDKDTLLEKQNFLTKLIQGD